MKPWDVYVMIDGAIICTALENGECINLGTLDAQESRVLADRLYRAADRADRVKAIEAERNVA